MLLYDVFVLYIVSSATISSDGYIVHNIKPDDNIGRIVTVALYKGDNHSRPFVSRQCGVGNYVTLTGSMKIYFGVIKPSHSLQHYHIIERQLKNETPFIKDMDLKNMTMLPNTEFTPLTEVDLAQFNYDAGGGVEVRLQEDLRNGELMFKCS